MLSRVLPVVLYVLFSAFFGPTARAATDERIALVIGAASYGPKAKLKNTLADAELFAETLKRVGFAEANVKLLKNPDRATMKKELRDFYNRARDIGGDGLAVFYFAGHGVQIEGENYLLPIEPDIIESEGSDISIMTRGIQPSEIIAELARTKIRNIAVFLDACRRNPFPQMQSGLVRDKLPEGASSSDILIGYATSYGGVASDGAGLNSPYTTALAEQLKVPGRPIYQSLAAVTRQVIHSTPDRQTPEVQGTSDLVLVQNRIALTFIPDQRFYNNAGTPQEPPHFTFAQLSRESIGTWSGPISAAAPVGAFGRFVGEAKKAIATGAPYTISPSLLQDLKNESDRGLSNSSLVVAVNYLDESMNKKADVEKYLIFMRRAIAQGSDSSIGLYANFLCCYEKGPRNIVDSISWLDAAISSGNTFSMIQRGDMYRDGIGSPHDIAAAERLYSQATENGDDQGILKSGDLYYYSDYGRVDRKKALGFYRKLTGLGYEFLAERIGRLVRFGVELDRSDANPSEALNILVEGTQSGCTACWGQIGDLLRSGELGKIERSAIYAAYVHGDEVNDGQSTIQMAFMLVDGDGIAKDDTAATQKFMKAAELGYKEGWYNAGYRLAKGSGTKPDPGKAAKFLRDFVAIDYHPDPEVRLYWSQNMIVTAARMLADLIEDKKVASVTPSELSELRARYGARNAKSVGFENDVDCAGKKGNISFRLFEWDRPNDETAMDVAAEIAKHFDGCIVPASDLADMKALKRQARETHSSFIDLVLKKYPLPKPTNTEPAAVQTPVKP